MPRFWFPFYARNNNERQIRNHLLGQGFTLLRRASDNDACICGTLGTDIFYWEMSNDQLTQIKRKGPTI